MDAQTPAAHDMDLLRHLADLNGIATHFWDWYGQRKDVSADSLLRVLQSLDLPVTPQATRADIHNALKETEDRHWRRLLPTTVVARQGESREFNVHVPDGHWVYVEWVSEEGARGHCQQQDRWVPPRKVDGQVIGRATFTVPSDMPLGWHRLVATAQDNQTCEATLIVVPQRLNVPLTDEPRRWGVAAQLYSIRSRTSWGMGDTADLADILALCGQQGADFLLMNPVHACAPITPIENSPYLPVSRRWVNPLYIHPESIEEYAFLSESDREYVQQLHEETNKATGTAAYIDRDVSWTGKCKALERIFYQPRSIHREIQFRTFVEKCGVDLENFALWCALVEDKGSLELPENMSNVHAPAVKEARHYFAERVLFWQWCQWVASEQLSHAQALARSLGMNVGVMADLAVGVHPTGSDVWSMPTVFARGMSVGAPPDMYSQQGQNWSQPPWSPRGLAEAGYAPLRDMLRAVLAHAGAVRIDHILGMFRLWWIPAGQEASAGTYVYYDHEAMVGVLLLEAQRAGAQIIGEDLGTVEPWVRDYLRERGVQGTSVLWFEKDQSGDPLHAQEYRTECLAAVTTHDLPPTAGYINGIQTSLRHELGLLVDDIQTVRQADRDEQERMRLRLYEYGLLDSDSAPTNNHTDTCEVDTQTFVEALHRYAARTPARLVVASLVDAVGDVRPQNLPGTYREYPNWCVPLCNEQGEEITVELLAHNDRFHSLSRVMRHELNDCPCEASSVG
ncbi:4-alpha-glucanotransferase [Schaalia sp. lx-100]|uniref:4-alpha-glucanotransferase n=1 Tax=Schaalia sp. lx-100 TaxID=2899081 RepID=UPI001E4BA6B7|nr:4-alpha-glucanotransferase [Schaalia sp. lx-100]